MIQLKYHDTVIDVLEPPAGRIETLVGKTIEPLSDFHSSMTNALNDPIGCEPLSDLIPSDGYITILIPDRTRNSKLNIVLPEIINYLKHFNVADDRIRFLVCLGTHGVHSHEQRLNLVGEEYLNRFKFFESHQEDPSAFSRVGETQRGTEVFYHNIALDSNLLIVTGSISFHYFAGFSGGRKAFIPGCAKVDTIQQNHSLTYILKNGECERNLNCESGRLDGNPVSDDMEGGLSLMPVKSFLINIIVTPTGEPASIFAGDVFHAHRAGCEIYRDLYSLPIREKADIIIASTGGYPADINLLQSHKSMINCSRAVKKGGTIFLVSRCPEGVSLSGYPEYMMTNTQRDLRKRLMEYYEIHGGTTDHLMDIAMNHRLFFVSELDYEVLGAVGIRSFKPGVDSWEDVFLGLNADSLCYLMPNASKYLPVYNGLE